MTKIFVVYTNCQSFYDRVFLWESFQEISTGECEAGKCEMNILTGFVLFVIIWVPVFFMILPFGYQQAQNAHQRPEQGADPIVGSNPQKGIMPGAPEQPRIGRKFLLSLLITALIWGSVLLLIFLDMFSFRQWANQILIAERM